MASLLSRAVSPAPSPLNPFSARGSASARHSSQLAGSPTQALSRSAARQVCQCCDVTVGFNGARPSSEAHRRLLTVSTRAVQEASSSASSTQPSPPSNSNAGKEIVPDTEISISKTSFGTIGLAVGVVLLVYGFGAYFTLLPGTVFSPLMLTYGFPITIIGFALKYAELEPVPCTSYADAVALRDQEATPILLQVRSDVTRYRYGDEQHLEEALKRIFRYNQAGGVQRRFAPKLTSISEEVYEGHYSLGLVFSAPALKLADFTDRQAKFTSFFGPGVNATVEGLSPTEFAVRLTATPK